MGRVLISCENHLTSENVMRRSINLVSPESLAHMDTGVDIATVRERLLFANAYLVGRLPFLMALKLVHKSHNKDSYSRANATGLGN